MDNNNSSKQILLSVLGVAILVVAVVGVSFAAFTFTGTGTQENKITTGTLTLTYTQAENGILIENMMPTTDTTGKALKEGRNVFDFTVAATMSDGANPITYTVSAVKDATVSTLGDNEVKLYLEELGTSGAETGTEKKAPSNFAVDAENTNTGKPADEMTLVNDSFTTSGTKYYRLKMWVADNYEPTSTAKAYSVKVNVHAKSAAK